MLIGLSGFISCGKDSVANYLVSNYGFKKISFASCLKDVCSVLFSWDRKLLEGDSEESRIFRETVDTWWSERLNIPNFTPRYAFQHIGTDTLRTYFHDNIWIAALEKKILSLSNQNLVCTDCRFPNEIECIKRLGGKVWKIERGIQPDWVPIAVLASQNNIEAITQCKKLKIHASEYSHLSSNFDAIIKNDHTLEKLYNEINFYFILQFPSFLKDTTQLSKLC
jgi:hypothetical protein